MLTFGQVMTRDYGDNADIIVELGIESFPSKRDEDRQALVDLANILEKTTTFFLRELVEKKR